VKRFKAGLGRWVREVIDHAGARVFERGDVTATAPRVEVEELGLPTSNPHRYQASPWLVLPRGMRGLRVTRDDVLVDFGSGKGRILFQAAKYYEFGRIIGVELSEQLNEIARRNIERNRHLLRCQDVEVVTADAASYPIPDEMTVAYFFNPFRGDTFRRTIDHIVESIDRRPRRVTLLYFDPLMDDYIEQTGRFELVRRSKGLRPRYRPSWVSVWASRPAEGNRNGDGAARSD
jgi:Methyltransferase domain